MIITPSLAQYFADRHGDAQRETAAAAAAAAIGAWRARDDVRAIDALLAQWAVHPPASPAALEAVLAPHIADPAWVGALLTHGLGLLRADPLNALPCTILPGPLLPGLLLLSHAGVTMSLHVVDAMALVAAAQHAPDTNLVFDGGLSAIVHLAGGAISYRRAHREAGDAGDAGDAAHARISALQDFAAGQMLVMDGACDGVAIISAARDALMLRISIGTPAAGSRHFAHRLSDGACVATLCGDAAASRLLILLQYLGARPDVIDDDVMDLLHQYMGDAEPQLRWAAARLALAHDPAGMRDAIADMARGDGDAGVRGAAAATLPIIDAALSARRAA